MPRLIDADALPRHGNRGGLVRWSDIEEAPTTEIVYCGDCKYSGAWFGHTMKCKRFNVLIDEKFFCAMGEWREEE